MNALCLCKVKDDREVIRCLGLKQMAGLVPGSVKWSDFRAFVQGGHCIERLKTIFSQRLGLEALPTRFRLEGDVPDTDERFWWDIGCMIECKTQGGYCSLPEDEIVLELKNDTVPDSALMDSCCWRTICSVSYPHRSDAWKKLCKRHAELNGFSKSSDR